MSIAGLKGSVLWPLLSNTLAGTVTERLECVHMQRAHIDLCCIVIHSGHFVEYSSPSVLQGDESGGGQGETCH